MNKNIKNGTTRLVALIAIVMSFVLACGFVLTQVACSKNEQPKTLAEKYNDEMLKSVELMDSLKIFDEVDGVEFYNLVRGISSNDWGEVTSLCNELMKDTGVQGTEIEDDALREFFVQLVDEYKNINQGDDITNPKNTRGIFISKSSIINMAFNIGIKLNVLIAGGSWVIAKLTAILALQIAWINSVLVIGTIVFAWVIANAAYVIAMMIRVVAEDRAGLELDARWFLFIPVAVTVKLV